MDFTAHPRRSRAVYAGLVLLVIGAGLLSRKLPGLHDVLDKYPGDALWALMVFLLVGLIQPGWPTVRVAAVALAVSFAVEFSQLYQAPWINAIRHTTLGHLVLGSTFNAPDLLAYAVGVVMGAVGEVVAVRASR